MMMWLWLAFALPEQITVTAELPAATTFLGIPLPTASFGIPSATAYFEDLNGDGVIDFWLRSDDQRMWVLDGASDEDTPQEIVFEEVEGIQVRPIYRDGAWHAQFLDEDHRVVFRTGQWQPERMWSTAQPMRDNSFVHQLGQRTLVPTTAGFELYENECFQRELLIRPTVKLSRSRLKVMYPVVQPLDLDSDGVEDWVGTPIALPNQGKLGIWRSMGEAAGQWQMLEFPPDLTISLYAFGDVDGDGLLDLAVMTRPAKGFSLFGEMGILFYAGTGPGTWSNLATQELKSKQNLWQTGPLELNRGGLYCYYYKGLFQSKFRIDRYLWDSDGFLEPRPKKTDWRMDSAERLTMIRDHDLTGDGVMDLILADNEGLWLYEAKQQDKLPFDEDRRQKLLDWPFPSDFNMDVAADGDQLWFPESDVLTDGWLRYRHSLAVVVEKATGQLQFWQVERNLENGHLQYQRTLPNNIAR